MNFYQRFLQYPSLIQRNSERVAQPKNVQFTIYLRVAPYYICRFTERLSKNNYKNPLTFYGTSQGQLSGQNFQFLYLYKGNYKRILVGCFAKVPSLNSHENGILAGCFFKKFKVCLQTPSHLIALGTTKT